MIGMREKKFFAQQFWSRFEAEGWAGVRVVNIASFFFLQEGFNKINWNSVSTF